MYKRSEAARKPIVSPAEPYRVEAPSSVLPASQRKDGTWQTRKQRFCRMYGPLASGFYESRTTCGLQSKPSRRPVAARNGKCVALRAAVLSGIPNIRIASFLHYPGLARDIPPPARSRRAREIPLAREDIPGQHSSLREFSTSAWPGSDFQFQSVSLFY